MIYSVDNVRVLHVPLFTHIQLSYITRDVSKSSQKNEQYKSVLGGHSDYRKFDKNVRGGWHVIWAAAAA